MTDAFPRYMRSPVFNLGHGMRSIKGGSWASSWSVAGEMEAPTQISMATTQDTSYGKPTWIQKIGAYASTKLHMPFVLAWALVISPFHPNNRHRTWRRIVGDKIFYHLSVRFNAKQLQWNFGTTLGVYKQVMKAQNLRITVDELGNDARLLWVGERRTDRVILYLHGGAFIFPMQDFALSYWRHLQVQLKERGKETGLVVLNYSLVPTASFPTQLNQAVSAVEHLLSTGVSSENLQIVGDSAGGNLIFQLVSHILHPVPEIPRLTLASPLRGIFAMSPWVSLTSKYGSMITNDKSDCISRAGLLYWGTMVLDGVPESMHHYLEAIKAPEDWFKGIAGITDRLLVTAGNAECLRDDIVIMAKKLEIAWLKSLDEESRHRVGDIQLIMQEHGVHDDPHLDFLLKEKKLTAHSWEIVDWVANGFE